MKPPVFEIYFASLASHFPCKISAAGRKVIGSKKNRRPFGESSILSLGGSKPITAAYLVSLPAAHDFSQQEI
jgi:hypothetical protein